MYPFSTPWKHQKTWQSSDVFLGDRERVHWEHQQQLYFSAAIQITLPEKYAQLSMKIFFNPLNTSVAPI